MMSKEEFPPMQTYSECPNCGKYRVAEFLIMFTSRNNDKRPDDWTRFLPWNWHGSLESDAFKSHGCKNCRHRVYVEELEDPE